MEKKNTRSNLNHNHHPHHLS